MLLVTKLLINWTILYNIKPLHHAELTQSIVFVRIHYSMQETVNLIISELDKKDIKNVTVSFVQDYP